MDRATLEQALRKADAMARQGDQRAAADARRLAQALIEMEAQPQRNADGTYGQPPEGYTMDPRTGQMRSRDMRGDDVGTGEGMLRSAAQGLSLGSMDEAVAAAVGAIDTMRGRGSFNESYTNRLEDERAKLEQFREDRPALAIGSEVAGALAIPAGTLNRGASLAGQALRSGTTAGATGAVYGFNAGEGGALARGQNAAVSGAVGAMTGAAVPYAVAGAERALTNRATGRALDQAAAAAPSIDELRDQSSRLYDAARARGVVVRQDAFAPLVDDIARSARELGVDPDITPAASAALRRFAGATERGDIGLGDLDILRRVAGNASTSPNPQDRKIAGMMVEKVDDYVLKLMDSDLAAGSADGLSEELTQARALWKQMRNSEMLGQAIERAKTQASGFENGIRIQFRQIRNNRKAWGRLSDAEKKAVTQVIEGSTTGNWLRRLAGLSFGEAGRRNVLGGLAGVATGSMAGGPIGAVAAPLIGQAAAQGAENVTLGLAQRAQGIAAAGGTAALPGAVNLPMLENALMRAARAQGAFTNQ